jgi:hypothetical protein
MKRYHISLDDNRQCDNCGGETSIQHLSHGLWWETLPPPLFFMEQPNLNFLWELRRWCDKCNKQMEIKYRLQKT